MLFPSIGVYMLKTINNKIKSVMPLASILVLFNLSIFIGMLKMV